MILLQGGRNKSIFFGVIIMDALNNGVDGQIKMPVLVARFARGIPPKKKKKYSQICPRAKKTIPSGAVQVVKKKKKSNNEHHILLN